MAKVERAGEKKEKLGKSGKQFLRFNQKRRERILKRGHFLFEFGTEPIRVWIMGYITVGFILYFP